MHRKKMFLAEDYPGYEMFAELTDAERQELLALVELAEEKTLEKLRAQAALRRIGQVFPKLAESA
ncbi:MAG: hypothetical protein HUU20_21540 [Pirellulales bacterium]|nr:hypothetical protein [Pirellulales bacterium]